MLIETANMAETSPYSIFMQQSAMKIIPVLPSCCKQLETHGMIPASWMIIAIWKNAFGKRVIRRLSDMSYLIP